jgi:hypothetical protein
MIMDAQRIKALCITHGAKAVSDAAYAAMTGQRTALDRLGLGDVRGVGALHEVTTIAFALMSPNERASDLTQATIDAARVK